MNVDAFGVVAAFNDQALIFVGSQRVLASHIGHPHGANIAFLHGAVVLDVYVVIGVAALSEGGAFEGPGHSRYLGHRIAQDVAQVIWIQLGDAPWFSICGGPSDVGFAVVIHEHARIDTSWENILMVDG